MSDNIKVVVKVRPLIPREVEDKLSYRWRVKNNSLLQLDPNGLETDTCFTFDKVYDKDTKTSVVYNDVAKPIVEAAIAGFNGTIFAYGQTSSGKTYTMSGTQESPGIIPMAILNLFEIIKNIPNRDFLVRVSYIEIYNEVLKDLLNVDNNNLKIHETFGGVKVDATEKVTSSPDEVLEIMRQGEANRQTGYTNMNEKSSRSHSIFQITIESREHTDAEEDVGCVNVSQLNLVDLAGSERAGQTGSTGMQFKEGININKSLLSLSLVIKSLSEKPNKYVNCRDSKLTRILSNSLGGNAKTSIICAVTPASVEETTSTLQFANRAKAIKNKPEVNAVATDATMIQSLTKQLSKLQKELAAKRNLEVMLESKKNVEVELQKQIAGLQKLILNGFEQRSCITSRKLVAPRRMTISTLHNIQEEPVTNAPRFATPCLKYNPMALSMESFIPIQSSKTLASVPEEARMVTPSPPDKHQIISLDSDEDEVSELTVCSPYHKCYNPSKTPPCVLRQNAKQAEKNLKDIVELTTIEKMYSPDVVELMTKLEQHTSSISTLKEEISTLHEQSKEKDIKIEKLTAKVCKTEEQVKSITSEKSKLETECKEKDTKLTDWEVTYDTLLKKYKTRESELLSLLEEQRQAKTFEDIGKLSKHIEKELSSFMDMSKDISLVNSDNEISIVQTNDDKPTEFQDIVTNLQTDLVIKNKTILDLEENLKSHKEKIEALEKTSEQLQSTIESFKSKITHIETENSFLKSTVDSLNSTVVGQKQHLESANKDIQSYNTMIQNLQTKLRNKEEILNRDIDETYIETMIDNEKMFIANNDNIQNIIHSFKIALDNKTKEINNLKSTQENNTELAADNIALKEQIEIKEKHINTLIEEAVKLKDQLNENINVINKLVEVEKDLTDKLNEAEQRNSENTNQIANLKTLNLELISKVADKVSIEEDMSIKNEDLTKQVHEMGQKIVTLEKDLIEKSDLSEQSKANVATIELIVTKLHDLLLLVGDYSEDLPETVTCVEAALNIIDDKLKILNDSIKEIIEEKSQSLLNVKSLQEKLVTISDIHKSEMTGLQTQVEAIKNEMLQQTEELTLQVTQLTKEVDRINAELDNKSQENIELEIKLNDAKENNENLRNDLLSKEDNISSLQDKIASIYKEIESIEQDKKKEIENIMTNKDIFEKLVAEKDSQMKALEEKLSNITVSVEEKYKEMVTALKDAIQNRDKLLEDILKKASKLTSDYDDGDKCADNTYENIIITLDKLADNILGKTETFDLEERLLAANQQIEELTNNNLKLIQDYVEVNDKNKELLLEIDRINKMNKELLGASDLLNQMKVELEGKLKEIKAMEDKALEWKEHFANYEASMKKRMEDLIVENNRLKHAQKSELRRQSSQSDTNINFSSLLIQNLSNNSDFNGPKSLKTICFNKIIDSIQPKEEINSVTTSSSKSSIQMQNAEIQTDPCDCERLSIQLSKITEENLKLVDQLGNISEQNLELVHLLKDVESSNQFLLQEREEVRKEIQMLVEPATELQKKIANHRTNVSTLTATTYAENKLLNSQLKVLKHHHTRYIQVCQRDLPGFKTQLCELMTILKGVPIDKHNSSFKRYSLPDVLDSSAAFKNESTLDGDLLMLDTNVTMTSADNTLVGPDQTCLDVTQVNFENDDCQTNDSKVIDPCLIYSQMEALSGDNRKLYEQLENVTQENCMLKEEIVKLSNTRTYKDSQNSPVKLGPGTDPDYCENCDLLLESEDKLNKELAVLTEEFKELRVQKEDIEKKYTTLTLEIPSTDTLVKKLKELELEHHKTTEELKNLTTQLNKKNQAIKELQEENDSLSNQIMDNISEVDDLKKELDDIRSINMKLSEKCEQYEQSSENSSEDTNTNVNRAITCLECQLKDELIKYLQTKQTEHTKLNRSFSDSESSTRHNKICTLQNELHASKEDCKKITQEVATIKDHLERSNMSVEQVMDLDESVGDSNIFALTKGLASPESMKKVKADKATDAYMADKMECLQFFVEKTGADKENLDKETRIIDVMEMFYKYFVSKHGREVENLTNKLKDFEETRSHLQMQLSHASTEYMKLKNSLLDSNNTVKTVTNVVAKVKRNFEAIQEIAESDDSDKYTKLVALFKENLLAVFDREFDLSTVSVFESLINNIVTKHEQDLSDIMDKYTQLQTHMEGVVKEFNAVNDNVIQMKTQLSDNEKDYNLLKAQKDKVSEISNAVTLDIVQKENELTEALKKGCERLKQCNIIVSIEDNPMVSVTEKINQLFDQLIQNQQKEMEQDVDECLSQEINVLKNTVDEKQKAINKLQAKLTETEIQIKHQNSKYEELSKNYENNIEENKSNLEKITQLSEEVAMLKQIVHGKVIGTTETNKNDLIKQLEQLKQDYNNLKTVHEMITKEKETYSFELEKAHEIISRNKLELDKMTSDILVLRESVNDNVCVIESLTMEAKSLIEKNQELKKLFEEKTIECSRLETNIKTHEKSAEIQSKRIIRLQKQKEEDDKASIEKDQKIEELTQKVTSLQTECDDLRENVREAREELNRLKNKKDSLEVKLSELETFSETGRRRQSIDMIAENARRRRQSMHDSMRPFDESVLYDDKMEAVFEARSSKPEELFTALEDGSSSRSTPSRISRGRESLPRCDPEDPPSRPSSALRRRRRQTAHDLHRGTTPLPVDNVTSPHGQQSLKPVDSATVTLDNSNSEINTLRAELSSCQQELEELKERYRELDEECDTCAQYLKERDEQIHKLCIQRGALQQQVKDLTEKLNNTKTQKCTSNLIDASVNTDEDWANLHSVVVDRMSFDAEVEKNKKLTRAIDELRASKQDLKNTIMKMQRAMEKSNADRDIRELEATKKELEELKERYRELDEECDTCAQYLKERDEQCRKLREDKAALEARLEQLESSSCNAMSAVVRRKRHSLHDHNRGADARLHSATDQYTDTSDDLLTYQVERDESSPKSANNAQAELVKVKAMLERVSLEKSALERQLAANPTYVATGSAIVQNQQITDVLKENQKLKKINAKLVNICKKRSRCHQCNRENEEPPEFG